jgi:hypothetical protein
MKDSNSRFRIPYCGIVFFEKLAGRCGAMIQAPGSRPAAFVTAVISR